MDQEEPDLVEISSNKRILTLTRYLPYTQYYDISNKTHRGDLIPRDNEATTVKGLVFFAPAMATRAGYYRYFLDYISSKGYIVYTFDFSGIDTSKFLPVKSSELTMKDWVNDLQIVVSWVMTNFEEQIQQLGFSLSSSPVKYYVCHSLGGQFFGFLSNQNWFDKLVAVTSQNGYWRFYVNTWRYFFFWYLLEPTLTNLFGYFPGKLVGFGEDIPPKIMNRWKKWCTSRNYFFDDKDFKPKYEQYQNSILTIGFTDDPWATLEAIDDLYQRYSNSNRDHWEIHPSDLDLDSIGHLGYFRPKSIELWEKTMDWLE